MKQSRTRSGQPDPVYAVRTPMAMMATFTKTSLRAERNAARLREPPRDRTLASIQALAPFTTIAPSKASTNGTTSGATGARRRPTGQPGRTSTAPLDCTTVF